MHCHPALPWVAVDCLSANGLVAFARGSFPSHDRSRVEEHLDSCELCRVLVAQAARSSPGDTIDPYERTEPLGPPRVLSPGDMLGARFRIVRPLGRGGMGMVFEAADAELGTHVALKVLAPEIAGAPGMLRRMRREILLGRRIVHPNVCRIFDIGRCGGLHFLTMELVDGVHLGRLLHHLPHVDPREARDWIGQMLLALAAIHDAGVVHRDLKPSNVMIEPSGRVVVMDFGLAGDLAEHTTLSAARVGTPAWWSPEQAQGLPATPRSDLFAFGLIAHAILGRVRGDAAAPFASLVTRCLARDPDVRPRSAQDLLAELDAGDAPEAPDRGRGKLLATLCAAAAILGVSAGLAISAATAGEREANDRSVSLAPAPSGTAPEATIEADPLPVPEQKARISAPAAIAQESTFEAQRAPAPVRLRRMARNRTATRMQREHETPSSAPALFFFE